MPGSRDIGENIKELKASKTKRPMRQIKAIAINQARKAGAHIPKRPSKK